MILSIYSFATTVIWFSIFILLSVFLQRKTGIVFSYRLVPLLFLLMLAIFRLFIPIEAPFAQVICSDKIYPAIQKTLRTPWFTLVHTQISCAHILFAIWFVVAAVLCVRLYLRIRRDQSFVENLPSLPCKKAIDCLEQLLCEHKKLPNVRLTVSPKIASPMLVGLINPCILLPQDILQTTDDEIKCILAHELTHLKNGDLWVKCLIRLLVCVMWWNPCVYLLTKDLDHVLEYKCDLDATKDMQKHEKIQYLQTLINVLRQIMTENEQAANIITSNVNFCGIPETVVLQRRFRLVLAEPQTNKRLPAVALICIFLMLFIGSYFVVLQPTSSPPNYELYGQNIITPENSYILAASDGIYYLIHNGIKSGEIPEKMLQDNPHCYLTIKKETT